MICMSTNYAFLPDAPIIKGKNPLTFMTLDLLIGIVKDGTTRHDALFGASADLCGKGVQRDLAYKLFCNGALRTGKDQKEIDEQFDAGWNKLAKNQIESDSLPFNILGFINPPMTAVYRRKDNCEVISLSFKNHKKTELLALASKSFWEVFGDGKINDFEIQAFLSEKAIAAGRFDSEKLRAYGAWWDNGEAVYNDGKFINDIPINEFKTKYFYRYGKKIITDSDPELYPALIDIADLLGLSSADKILLLGWCVIAPICGALSWRPHIWLTANHESGKSTVLEKFIIKIIGKNVPALSGTTEAGLRQALENNALPITYDEAEGNSHATQGIMTKVLEMARKSSSNSSGSTFKGTPLGKVFNYDPHSCFCFSSINPPIELAADESRITIIEYHKKSGDEWIKLRTALKNITILKCSQLVKNTIKNINNVLASIRIVNDLLLNSYPDKARMGDQFAPMIAGYWHVAHNEIIDDESAKTLIEKIFDQPDETKCLDREKEANEILPDSIQCLQDIMTIGIPFGGGELRSIRNIILDEINFIPNDNSKDFVSEFPIKRLYPYGISVSSDKASIYIHEQNTEFKKLLEKTPWRTGIRKVLKRIDGVKANYSTSIGGFRCAAIKIPTEKIL